MWKLSFMITRHINTRLILFLDVLIVLSLKKHKILLLHFLLHGFLLLFHTNSDLFKLQTELSTEIQSGLQNPDRVYSPTIRAVTRWWFPLTNSGSQSLMEGNFLLPRTGRLIQVTRWSTPEISVTG